MSGALALVLPFVVLFIYAMVQRRHRRKRAVIADEMRRAAEEQARRAAIPELERQLLPRFGQSVWMWQQTARAKVKNVVIPCVCLDCVVPEVDGWEGSPCDLAGSRSSQPRAHPVGVYDRFGAPVFVEEGDPYWRLFQDQRERIGQAYQVPGSVMFPALTPALVDQLEREFLAAFPQHIRRSPDRGGK